MHEDTPALNLRLKEHGMDVAALKTLASDSELNKRGNVLATIGEVNVSIPNGEVSVLNMGNYAGTRVSNNDDPRL